MRGLTRGLAAVALIAAGACISEQNRVPLSMSGIVRLNGSPVGGATVELFRPSVSGLPESAGSVTTGADGVYALSTETEEVRCFMAFVEVDLANPAGPPDFNARANALNCGSNVADFDFP